MHETVSLKTLRDRPFELLAELERRGRGVTAAPAEQADPDSEWVGVAVRMAGETYLVARDEAREVLSLPTPLTRVPGAKPWLLGIGNVRGALFPITDLRQFLGGGVTSHSRNARVVIVNHREIPAGLLVDEVLGFRRFPESAFSTERPNTIVPSERFLAGSFMHEGRPLPVLALRQLVEDASFAGAAA